MIRASVLAILSVLVACAPADAVVRVHEAGGYRVVERVDADPIVRAVMNEAEGESYESKLAHAYMFFNRVRAGMDLGSSGLDSVRVRNRLARAGATAWADARRAVACAAVSCVPDPTKGAFYSENVKKFGVPDHIRRAGKSVVPTVKIGDVQFWRKAK